MVKDIINSTINKITFVEEDINIEISIGVYDINIILRENGDISIINDKNLSDLNHSFKNSIKENFKNIKDLTIDKIELFGKDNIDVCNIKLFSNNTNINSNIEMRFAQNFNTMPLPFYNSKTSLFFRKSDIKTIFDILHKYKEDRNNSSFGITLTFLQMVIDSIISNRFLHYILLIQTIVTLTENKDQLNETIYINKKIKIKDKDIDIKSSLSLDLNKLTLFFDVNLNIEGKIYPLFNKESGEYNLHTYENLLKLFFNKDSLQLTNISKDGMQTEDFFFLWDEDKKKIIYSIEKFEPKQTYLSNKSIDLNIKTLEINNIMDLSSLLEDFINNLEINLKDDPYE